jgi:hypothetical protein
MSFRVKTTHQLLEPEKPPVQPSNTNNMFLATDNDHSLNDPNSMLASSILSTAQDEARRNAQNRPTAGSKVGLAIRNVPTAQADHM